MLLRVLSHIQKQIDATSAQQTATPSAASLAGASGATGSSSSSSVPRNAAAGVGGAFLSAYEAGTRLAQCMSSMSYTLSCKLGDSCTPSSTLAAHSIALTKALERLLRSNPSGGTAVFLTPSTAEVVKAVCTGFLEVGQSLCCTAVQAGAGSSEQQRLFSLGCTLLKVCAALGPGQRAADMCCLHLGVCASEFWQQAAQESNVSRASAAVLGSMPSSYRMKERPDSEEEPRPAAEFIPHMVSKTGVKLVGGLMWLVLLGRCCLGSWTAAAAAEQAGSYTWAAADADANAGASCCCNNTTRCSSNSGSSSGTVAGVTCWPLF